MPLVEVITGEKTSAETAAAAVRFVQKIGKMPVLVRDSPGFLVNRILLPYMVEAGELFAHGAAIEEVDVAMLDFGMPMGPLRLIDEVGLDVAEDVAATLAAAFPGHMHVPAVLSRMLDAGLLGQKIRTRLLRSQKGKGRSEPGSHRISRCQLPPLHSGPRGHAAPHGAADGQRGGAMHRGKGGGGTGGRRFRNDHGRGLRRRSAAGRSGMPIRWDPRPIADALGEETARSGAHFTPCELLRGNDPNKQEILCRQLNPKP